MQNFRTLGKPITGEENPQETPRRLWDEDSVGYERRGKKSLLVATTFWLQCLRALQALRLDKNIQTAPPPSWMWGKTFIFHIKFVSQTIKLWQGNIMWREIHNWVRQPLVGGLGKGQTVGGVLSINKLMIRSFWKLFLFDWRLSFCFTGCMSKKKWFTQPCC